MLKNSPLAEKESICAEDLWDKSLIISHQTAISNDMITWLQKDISQLNIVATYDLLYNASRFVKMDFGYAIPLNKLINTSGDSEPCFRRLYPASETGLCIIWKKYQVFSIAAERFIQKLRLEFEL